MINVVLFTLSLRNGGTERQVANLARWLDRQRFRVVVIVLFPDRTPLMDAVIAAGIPVYADWFAGRLGFLRGMFRLMAYLRRERMQVIHTYLTTAYLFSAIPAWLAGVPARIVSERSTRRPIWPKRGWLIRPLLALVQRIEVNAEASRDILIHDERIDPSKIVFHRNAVRPEFFDPQLAPPNETWVQPGRIRVGTVANIHPYKNLLLLAQAIADLCNDYPNVDAVHIGRAFLAEGEAASAELQQFVGDHLGSRWMALGGRDDIPNLLQALDIFVLTSNFEGTSNAMLEAMASGLPVISTDVGDAKAILSESGGGIIVPVGDRAALVAALRQLIDDADLRQQMGEANRQWALANLSPERLTRQVEALYESLLRGELT